MGYQQPAFTHMTTSDHVPLRAYDGRLRNERDFWRNKYNDLKFSDIILSHICYQILLFVDYMRLFIHYMRPFLLYTALI